VKYYVWSIELCGAENWTLWQVDHKYLESFEMWCSKRTEKIIWTGRVRKEYVSLQSQGGEEYPIYIKKKKG
jgi:hypothetical protein